ncbi:hypothetical protein SAMN02745702_00698 [Desulfobaculum bizertense DSM 18034]|uniref:Uncharacterized protein n=1 Tax=Desulfobaculum bizertense DSM 18034 TaxID=1121442 RepID=A0A1T4VPH4_9BACT|nr:hypothetical protein SAMN02745702_00698 [Desulfobaculum bizertense DSM 18034]
MGEYWGPAPKPPRKGMIPLRILIEFKSRASFACTAFKLVGHNVESLFLFCEFAAIFFLNARVQKEKKRVLEKAKEHAFGKRRLGQNLRGRM